MLDIHNGDIYLTAGYRSLKHPAVMFDKVTGTLHAVGNTDFIVDKWIEWWRRDTQKRVIMDLVICAFDMSKSSSQQVLDEINKMRTHSGYCKLFYERNLCKEG